MNSQKLPRRSSNCQPMRFCEVKQQEHLTVQAIGALGTILKACVTKLTRGGEEVKGALQHYLTSTHVLSGARSRNSEAPGGRSSSSSSRRRELAAEVGQEVVATPRRVVFLFLFFFFLKNTLR